MKNGLKTIVLVGVKLLYALQAWAITPLFSAVKGHRLFRMGRTLRVALPAGETFNGELEVAKTLEKLTAVLDKLGVQYFILRQQGYKLSVAVMSPDRSKVIHALHRHRIFSGYYQLTIKDRHNVNMARLWDFGLSKSQSVQTLAISIYRNIGDRGGRIIDGEPFSVRLEFWSQPEDLDPQGLKSAMLESGILEEHALERAIISPVPNDIAKVFIGDAQDRMIIKINNKKYETLKIFEAPTMDKVSFPIDIVYTWVDGSDAKWLASYEKARRMLEPSYKNNSMSRYTDHQELRYSLRSIEMYAPWVRKVYIVTASQTPAWLSDSLDGRVEVVDQNDIFADPTALPVFNSHAIESQLHHIPGLSEHYLYLNDDMFFASPVRPETFFFANGIAKVQLSPATIGTGEGIADETAPSSAGKNARAIISKQFGVLPMRKIRHMAYPQRRSLANDIEKRHPEVIAATMASKFRSKTDIPFTSSLMQYYLLASGLGTPSKVSGGTIEILTPTSEQELNMALSPMNTQSMLCINETVTPESKAEYIDQIMANFLNKSFPYKSPWEK